MNGSLTSLYLHCITRAMVVFVNELQLTVVDETITYVKSDGGRKRSDTIVYYELLFTNSYDYLKLQ